jgi:hypothetical protein
LIQQYLKNSSEQWRASAIRHAIRLGNEVPAFKKAKSKEGSNQTTGSNERNIIVPTAQKSKTNKKKTANTVGVDIYITSFVLIIALQTMQNAKKTRAVSGSSTSMKAPAQRHGPQPSITVMAQLYQVGC